MENNVQELLRYRAGLFRTASGFEKKPERVPHLSNYITWPIFDAGYQLTEAINDYDKMEKVVINHITKYQWDAIIGYGVRNRNRVVRELNAEFYKIDDEAGSITVQDYSLVEGNELLELAKDPIKMMWEVCLGRKFSSFNSEMPLEQFQRVVNENLLFDQFASKVIGRAINEFGLPSITDGSLGSAYFGMENLFSMLRGIRGFSIDMRRNKDAMKVAAEALDALYVNPSLEKIKQSTYGPNENTCWDYGLGFLAPTVMNRKQFEEFYWPTIEKVCDALAEKGKSVRVIIQGKSEPFIPFFYERYPHNMFTYLLETDDIFAIREKYPDVPLAGGMTDTFLGSASVQEVLDRAKLLVREIGADGGYIMTQDKMGSFRNDGNADNLKALCHYMAYEQ